MLNYLPLESSESTYIPSCTSTYDAQPSYKISTKSLVRFERNDLSCANANKERRRTDRQTGNFYIPPYFVCGVYNCFRLYYRIRGRQDPFFGQSENWLILRFLYPFLHIMISEFELSLPLRVGHLNVRFHILRSYVYFNPTECRAPA